MADITVRPMQIFREILEEFKKFLYNDVQVFGVKVCCSPYEAIMSQIEWGNLDDKYIQFLDDLVTFSVDDLIEKYATDEIRHKIGIVARIINLQDKLSVKKNMEKILIFIYADNMGIERLLTHIEKYANVTDDIRNYTEMKLTKDLVNYLTLICNK